MAIDSTAELLFRVSADPRDAEDNMRRFRGILSKDLSQLGNEFSSWSGKVFGDLGTLRGAAVAGFAALAAGAVGAGAALLATAEKAARYAEEIDRGMDVTGLSAQQMSALKFAAEATGTSYNSLVQGLTLFSSSVDAARKGVDEKQRAFARLRISQKDLDAGSRDLHGLLLKVSDAFRDNSNAVEKAALARELFGRGGAALIDTLNLGSKGIAELTKKAQEMGLVIDLEAIAATKRWIQAKRELSEAFHGLAIRIGTEAIPVMTVWIVSTAAAAAVTLDWAKKLEIAWRTGFRVLPSNLNIWKQFKDDLFKIFDEIAGRAQLALGQTGQTGFLPSAEKAKGEAFKLADQYDKALTEALQKVRRPTLLPDVRFQEFLESLTGLSEETIFGLEEENRQRNEQIELIEKAAERTREAALAQFEFREFFGRIREEALETRLALRAFQESKGWQGLFGEPFREAIRQNRELFREWTLGVSSNSLLLEATFASLEQMAKRTFQTFAAGMGQNIALAIVYRKSIGEAMREAVAQTLAAIAAESFVQAIYATALGFLRLAQHDYKAAAEAFTSAGIFAAVGGAAAFAGRAIAPREGGAAGRSGEAEAGGRAAGAAAGLGAPEETGPRITVVVQGHVIGASGIEELAEILNDAVKNRDVRLISTQARQAGSETA